ncbi:MAG: hydrogenase maturation protease [Phycisphaerae bacterium]
MPPTAPIFCDSAARLADALRASLAPPLAVVGIGNALRGDDAFGPAVVAALEPCPALRLFDVQAVPESFLVPIASCGASAVLFVDAADLGAAPGRVAFVEADRLAEVDVSTHAISLSLVAEAIRGLARESRRAGSRDLSCALLGAQPADLTIADRLSPAMESAVQLTADALRAFACPP